MDFGPKRGIRSGLTLSVTITASIRSPNRIIGAVDLSNCTATTSCILESRSAATRQPGACCGLKNSELVADRLGLTQLLEFLSTSFMILPCKFNNVIKRQKYVQVDCIVKDGSANHWLFSGSRGSGG